MSENLLWFQKYRPTTLDTFVGNDELKNYIQSAIESNNIENLIFYGKPGGGKTTAAKIIMNSLKCDKLYLNGSDENGIDTVRDKIKAFAYAGSFASIKIVVLDDCHNLTPAAQQALLNLIESFKKTRFIFTTNSIGKLIPALQSRCKSFHIVPPDKDQVAEYLDSILISENVVYDINDLVNLVNKNYPDIRIMINAIQSGSKNQRYIPGSNNSSNRYMDLIIEEIKKGNWKQSRQIVNDNGINDFTDLYKYLYEKVDNFCPKDSGAATLVIAEAEYQSSFVPDREITFMACIYQLIKLLK